MHVVSLRPCTPQGRTRYTSGGRGSCAPEIGRRLPICRYPRRVGAGSARHPLRGTKRQWFLRQRERVDGTRRACVAPPDFPLRLAWRLLTRPPLGISFAMRRRCILAAASSCGLASRCGKRSRHAATAITERARRLRQPGRLSPGASPGDPPGQRPLRPRSAFRRVEPLSAARGQPPIGAGRTHRSGSGRRHYTDSKTPLEPRSSRRSIRRWQVHEEEYAVGERTGRARSSLANLLGR